MIRPTLMRPNNNNVNYALRKKNTKHTFTITTETQIFVWDLAHILWCAMVMSSFDRVSLSLCLSLSFMGVVCPVMYRFYVNLGYWKSALICACRCLGVCMCIEEKLLSMWLNEWMTYLYANWWDWNGFITKWKTIEHLIYVWLGSKKYT